MDRKLKIETLAFVLFLIAFPIISIGTSGGRSLVWWLGLLSLVAAGLLPVWTRYMNHSRDKPRDAGMEFDDRTS